jgi:hypothetical protein
MNVSRNKFVNIQKALAFAERQLKEGKGNIRIITSKSKLAKRYNVEGEWVLVRYW